MHHIFLVGILYFFFDVGSKTGEIKMQYFFTSSLCLNLPAVIINILDAEKTKEFPVFLFPSYKLTCKLKVFHSNKVTKLLLFKFITLARWNQESSYILLSNLPLQIFCTYKFVVSNLE